MIDDVIVQSYKYDGSEHRRWSARLAHLEGPLIVLDAKFAEEVQHAILGTIPSGMVSVEYYWLDRWYNIFRFQDSSGDLRNYYCNINLPPQFDGRLLRYVDLDIDILVHPNLSYQVLDLDEFRHNAVLYAYSAEVKQHVQDGLDQLVELIEKRGFPFGPHHN